MGKRRRPGQVNTGRFSAEVIDSVLKEYGDAGDVKGLLAGLTSAVVNRAMQAELSHELGYEPGEAIPDGQTNRRNGTTTKRVRSDQGEMELEVPRDREGKFEPQIVPRHQRHFNGFDDKILAMYARGMSVRDIRSQLEEIYGVDVSADLISRVTDGVVEHLRSWQHRPLEPVYCIVYMDALVAKIRDKAGVRNMSIYVVVGIAPDGIKSVLGLWVQQTEGAKFWCSVMEQLRQRGVQDILVLCTDGLIGMSEAAEAIFPQAIYQTCIVHVIRSSTRFVSWKDKKAVCADLRAIYTAVTVEQAEQALDDFEAKWNTSYPTVARTWRNRWHEIIPFLAFPAEIRRAIYTTNVIESLNRQFRKILKTKGHLPSEDAAMKLLYLSLIHGTRTWGGRSRDWGKALNQFAIYFEGRLPQ
jgi:putative transposase